MAQDTRKDPRAKVLTMTVRYKSATVDEFIEHHSHDVSRGGIYIKTPSPFQPGTLLKFEIRIADDKPMLQGVGRVVWKRESPGPGSEKPAGMGVKFIKVDEASRHLIDRLVDSHAGQTSSYDAEPADAAASGSLRSTQAGMRPAGADPARGAQAGAPARRAGTMIGLGVEPAPAAEGGSPATRGVQRPSQVPRPADAMFPKTDSEGDMPPMEERTVMKQAAQLLEEALKGAGGSIEELGGAQGESVAKPTAKPVVIEAARPSGSGLASGAARPSPLPARRAPEASASASATPAVRAPKPRAPLEPARAAAAPANEKKSASANTIGISLLLVAAASAVGYAAWSSQAPDGAPEPSSAVPPVTIAPPPTPAPAIPQPPLPAEPATPAPATGALGTATAAAPAGTAATAPPSGVASAPSTVLPARPAVSASAPALAPPATVPAPSAAAVTPPPTAREALKPAPVVPVERDVPKPAPVVVAKPRPKPVEGAPAAPKPTPKPDDDNPY